MTKGRKFLAALLVAIPVFAQAQRTYSQPELDQMLAPIALYPDGLLSQVLMAATYPHEVAEAARWSRANPGLQGDDAVRAVQHEGWDPSVKSLVAFAQLLARMDENPAWTRSLGDAFLMQEPQVMNTVQQLRSRARTAGQLVADERLKVIEQANSILIQPANPQIIYLPYYDPRLVYGPWWWPRHQPVYWAPWPRAHRIHISLGFFFGDVDWHHRHVRVVRPTVYYYRPSIVVNRTVAVTPHRWQHEPRRRELRAIEPPRRVVVTSVPAAAPAARVAPPASVAAPVRVEARPFQAPVQTRPSAEVRPQPQLRPAQAAPAQVRMPAAIAPQQPRAQRLEPQHAPRLAPRGDQRNEQRPRGRERS